MSNESDSAPTVHEGSPNAQLQHAVFQRLGLLGRQGLRRVNVTVDDRGVVLSGTVSSFYLKQIAQEAARQACPNRKLYNDLDVVQAS